MFKKIIFKDKYYTMNSNKETKRKLLTEADSRVEDAVKVFVQAKTNMDEAQTALKMKLSHHFIKLYPEDLTDISQKISDAINALTAFTEKMRIQLKQ
jgi:hypothetical protein